MAPTIELLDVNVEPPPRPADLRSKPLEFPGRVASLGLTYAMRFFAHVQFSVIV